MNNKFELIYEGKAKKVFTHNDWDKVFIEFKDEATAFNAKKKAKFEGFGHLPQPPDWLTRALILLSLTDEGMYFLSSLV